MHLIYETLYCDVTIAEFENLNLRFLFALFEQDILFVGFISGKEKTLRVFKFYFGLYVVTWPVAMATSIQNISLTEPYYM